MSWLPSPFISSSFIFFLCLRFFFFLLLLFFLLFLLIFLSCLIIIRIIISTTYCSPSFHNSCSCCCWCSCSLLPLLLFLFHLLATAAPRDAQVLPHSTTVYHAQTSYICQLCFHSDHPVRRQQGTSNTRQQTL